jgi:hypothetical protein
MSALLPLFWFTFRDRILTDGFVLSVDVVVDEELDAIDLNGDECNESLVSMDGEELD